VKKTDAELVQRAQRGDKDALVELYECYNASVFTYIYFRVDELKTAEDLTAEVFVRMVTKIGSYVEKGRPILSWLYTIARNLIIDYYRVKGSQIEMPLLETQVSDENAHPAAIAESELERASLRRAMKYLTEDQRRVVLLKFIEGRENSEVAVILGKNERAIRSLQHRALVTLQRVMKLGGA